MNNNRSESIEHIYIHIPFCLRKCSYCSFYSENYSQQKSEEYTDHLLREIELFRKKYVLHPKTIYFGGGTPSLLKTEQLRNILSSLDLSSIEEITIEANPKTISEQKADDWLDAGINRVSLGAQSFLKKELEILGRLHDVQDISNAWHLLKKTGFTNLSLDLMYGLPNQTHSDLVISLQETVKLDPQHISIYCLSLEENVPLYAYKDQIVSDDTAAQFYLTIRNQLTDAGYKQYEISNFARSGYESRHNISYWNDSYYVGLGPSASGYLLQQNSTGKISRFRYSNKMTMEEYYRDIDNDIITNIPQTITSSDHQKEYIFLGLRRASGLDLGLFKDQFQEDFLVKYSAIIAKFQKLDLLEITSNNIKLKPEAYFISNEIFNEFI